MPPDVQRSAVCGLSGKIPEEDTISVDKKGRVTSTIVEDFDKEFYDAEELEGEIDAELAEYNQNFAADHIRKEAFEVEDGVRPCSWFLTRVNIMPIIQDLRCSRGRYTRSRVV